MLKRIKKTYKRRYTKRRNSSVLEQGNCFLSESEDKKRRKHLSYFILGLATLLVAVPCLFLLKTRIEQSMFIASEQEILKEQKAISMVMVFYKHQKGYAEYCRSLGVFSERYPKTFSEYFKDQQNVLDAYLKETRGFGLQQSYDKLKDKFSRVIDKSIEINFDKMGQDFALYQNDSTVLTHKDICILLEEKSSDILKSYLHPDYLRLQEGFNLLTGLKN